MCIPRFFCCCLFVCLFVLVGLGFELRVSPLQESPTTCATPPVHFALIILEMESHELFAWAGFEL
jgi:hypothetical protein